eukprot:TRINITY_DN12029_c0_g1_i2.p1 TRINITY_DN12029_c0_g1~~TRINITY_DN12029_c0_g1_i2.p1  ORF type:complete len:374 (+),score=34.23 TRINITY_DN12029_c0_g1_i2:347-1468(+)
MRQRPLVDDIRRRADDEAAYDDFRRRTAHSLSALVNVREARGLNGRATSYVVVQAGNQERETDVRTGQNPIWDEEFIFSNVFYGQPLEFVVFNDNTELEIGSCMFPLSAPKTETWLPLKDSNGAPAGELLVSVLTGKGPAPAEPAIRVDPPTTVRRRQRIGIHSQSDAVLDYPDNHPPIREELEESMPVTVPGTLQTYQQSQQILYVDPSQLHSLQLVPYMPPTAQTNLAPARQSYSLLQPPAPIPGEEYGYQACVDALLKGDWFFKWNGDRSVCNKRWIWLEPSMNYILWASAPNGQLGGRAPVQSCVNILSEQTTDHTGQYFNILVVLMNQSLLLATQIPEKFKMWFYGLSKVTERFRGMLGYPADDFGRR